MVVFGTYAVLSQYIANSVSKMVPLYVLYSGLILRGEDFEVFVDFTLSSKF